MIYLRLLRFLTTAAACSAAVFFFSSITEAQPKPKLVIFISVDQMRPDYFDKFGDEFTGGFKRLYEEGFFYSNADLNFSSSETGPGHATLGTGSYPRVSGILQNEWFNPFFGNYVYCVEDESAEVVEDSGTAASPRNLMTTGLADWVRARYPDSRYISISVKDRAAVLMGGMHPTYAFWYQRTSGRFITTNYYARSLPEWVLRFNASDWHANNVPQAWTKLLPDSAYDRYGPDDQEGEGFRNGKRTFPYAFNREKITSDIAATPWADMIVLDFARAAIAAELLGRKKSPDVLALSLSATDYVGHQFGPDSHEMHDHLLRVDIALGNFFAYVDSVVGKDAYVIALSADHAVLPLPEFLVQHRGIPSRRVDFQSEIVPVIRNAEEQLKTELNTTEQLIDTRGVLNYSPALAAGLDSLTFEQKMRNVFLSSRDVRRVYFRRDLSIQPLESDTTQEKFYNAYYIPRGRDFVLQFQEYLLLTSSRTGTSHGSVYFYDTHVPVVFWGRGIPSGKSEKRVHSADVAPTIAAMLGVQIPPSATGGPLREITRRK